MTQKLDRGTAGKKGDGWQARLPRSMGRKTIGTYATRKEARGVLAATLRELDEGRAFLRGKETLTHMYEEWLKLRVANGFASTKYDESRFDRHVRNAKIAMMPLTDITEQTVREYRNDLQGGALSNQTIKHVLNVVRGVLQHACEKGKFVTNPAREITVTRKVLKVTVAPWTNLDNDEIAALLNAPATPTYGKRMMAVAIGTGLRWGELVSLRVENVHLDDKAAQASGPHLEVLYGSPDRVPKNGRSRRVPLFGIALEALEQWLGCELEVHCKPNEEGITNPQGLLFPTASGTTWYNCKLRGWPKWKRAAGIKRRVRWHDLRHTCASALVSGQWGRKWSLDEVRDMLGHSSIRVTERYAHLAHTALEAAAKATREMVTAPGRTIEQTSANQAEPQNSEAKGRAFESRRARRDSQENTEAGDRLGDQALEILGFASANNAEKFWASAEAFAQRILEHPEVRAALAVIDGTATVAQVIELAQAYLPSQLSRDAKRGAK